MRRNMIQAFLLLTLAAFTGCSADELGTGVANPPSTTTSTSKAAAAISAIFATEEESASLSAVLVGNVRVRRSLWQTDNDSGGEGEEGDNRDCGEDDPECTCAEALDEFAGQGGPEGIVMGGFGDTGFYGSVDYGVLLAVTDFCAESDGTENTGLGADGRGRFATFELTTDVMGVCQSEDQETDFAMASGSTGVWRNTGETADEPAYMPQIHGSFVFEFSGEALGVDCTIFLGESESIVFADCTDENGESIAQDTEETCEFNTE